MIVSNEKNFVFMHNPKVAGTSVRKVLEPLRDTPFDFANNRPDPLTGERIIDRSHLGIDEFAHYYPSLWQRAKRLTFFALYRDPKARFLAAINQYSKMYGDTDIRFAPLGKRSDFFKRTLEQLEAMGTAEKTMDNHELAFFRPQWIFMESTNPERRDLKVRAYALSEFDEFTRDISMVTGNRLQFPRENSSEQFSVGGLAGAVLSNNQIKKSLRRLPGSAAAMRLLRKSSRTDTSRDSLAPEQRFGLNASESVAFEGFIKRFYAKDIALFDRLRKTPRPALEFEAAAVS